MKKEVKKTTKRKVSPKEKTVTPKKTKREKVTVEKTITKFNKTSFGKFVKLCFCVSIILILIALILLVFELYVAVKGLSFEEYSSYFKLADLLIDKGGFILLISFMCYAFAMPSVTNKDTKKKKDENTFIVAFKSPAVHAVIIMLMTFYLIYVCYEIGLIVGNMF